MQFGLLMFEARQEQSLSDNQSISLFDFFRGSVGCALISSGAGLNLSPVRGRVNRSLGLVFVASSPGLYR